MDWIRTDTCSGPAECSCPEPDRCGVGRTAYTRQCAAGVQNTTEMKSCHPDLCPGMARFLYATRFDGYVMMEYLYDADTAYLDDLMPWSENLPDVCKKTP